MWGNGGGQVEHERFGQTIEMVERRRGKGEVIEVYGAVELTQREWYKKDNEKRGWGSGERNRDDDEEVGRGIMMTREHRVGTQELAYRTAFWESDIIKSNARITHLLRIVVYTALVFSVNLYAVYYFFQTHNKRQFLLVWVKKCKIFQSRITQNLCWYQKPLTRTWSKRVWKLVGTDEIQYWWLALIWLHWAWLALILYSYTEHD